MQHHLEQLQVALGAWHEREWPSPEVLVVSGSGLAVDLPGATAHRAPLDQVIPFPIRGVIGHPLEVVLLEPVPGRVVAYQRGRLHSYQGYDANQIVFMVRLAALLGTRTLVMTNAAGGVHRSQSAGEVAVISDQINLTGLNPLRGELPAEWGPQFPDMVAAHDPALGRIALDIAGELGVACSQGVYAGFAGPCYETPAEVRMAEVMGADLVGMSTVLEVIAARHMGVRCLCLSLISNPASGVTGEPVDHVEVLDASQAAADQVRRVLSELLTRTELYD
ncbi:MAG: purine-nucleoside phosphorylase [Thermoanaerobaculia bacterium]